MSEKEYNKIFSENLKNFMAAHGMNQTAIAKSVGVSTSAVSDWCAGKLSPRIDKIDRLCEIFGCTRSDLMLEHSAEYISAEAERDRLFRDYGVLLHAMDGLKTEDLELLVSMAKRMKDAYRD